MFSELPSDKVPWEKGSRKKVFFSGPATKRGVGVRAWPLRKNFVVATKLEGDGGVRP